VRTTIQNAEVVSVDTENNTIAVKGAVPGANGSYAIIRYAKKKILTPRIEESKEETDREEGRETKDEGRGMKDVKESKGQEKAQEKKDVKESKVQEETQEATNKKEDK